MSGFLRRGTCIVTGGAGFIGTAIAQGLVLRFERVVVIDVMHPQVHENQGLPAALPSCIEFIHGDITEGRTWDAVLPGAKPAMIVHLAAETGTGQSLTEAARHSHTNVCGTATMLDALVRHEVQPGRIILTSSRAIYGEGTWRSRDGARSIPPGQRTRAQLERGQWDFLDAVIVPSCAASTVPSPVSVYGATKLAQEHLIKSWASAFGTECTILRLQNVYGPGQSLINSYTGILTLFCRLARQGLSIPLYEDGEMLRDFVLIDDVAAAILRSVDQDISPLVPYDVGTGKPITIGEMAHRIATFYGAPAPAICGKHRFGDVRHAVCNIDATITGLGWTPAHSIEEGLQALLSWVDTQLRTTHDEDRREATNEQEYADINAIK